MKCPRCETAPLEERDRDGITIDVCQRCRGIWLDRGELEKLISRSTEDYDMSERKYREYHEQDDNDYDRYARRNHHDKHHDNKHPQNYRRKRSWIESLGDIFD